MPMGFLFSYGLNEDSSVTFYMPVAPSLDGSLQKSSLKYCGHFSGLEAVTSRTESLDDYFATDKPPLTIIVAL